MLHKHIHKQTDMIYLSMLCLFKTLVPNSVAQAAPGVPSSWSALVGHRTACGVGLHLPPKERGEKQLGPHRGSGFVYFLIFSIFLKETVFFLNKNKFFFFFSRIFRKCFMEVPVFGGCWTNRSNSHSMGLGCTHWRQLCPAATEFVRQEGP